MAYETLTIRIRPELRHAIDEILAHKREGAPRLSLNSLLATWIEEKVLEARAKATSDYPVLD